MKVLVTGASGFLGRAVVQAAMTAGHDVVAVVRPTADVGRLGWPESVTVVRGDLRQRGDWRDGLDGVEAVIHLAAAVGGDLFTQFSGTVVATETLLAALPLAALDRFVHVSSFSVYDYTAVGGGGTLSEQTPLEPRPEARDAYTHTKLIQERLVRAACAAAGTPHVVIRPGAIYGPGKDWGFGRAMKIGPVDLLFAPFGRFKLTFVDNCADAIVLALRASVAAGSTFNIVDDDLPSHRQYHRLCRQAGAATGRSIWVPWWLVATLGLTTDLINRLAFGGRAKLPAFMAYRPQQASWKPLRYSNRAAKAGLGWTPRVLWREAIGRTIAGAERLAVGSDQAGAVKEVRLMPRPARDADA